MINEKNLFTNTKVINNIKKSFNCLIIEVKIIKIFYLNL